jgi:anaerobic magnesium-protoporphyrin IX monomethyl ester cyclase
VTQMQNTQDQETVIPSMTVGDIDMKNQSRVLHNPDKKDILFINPPYERLKGFTIASIPNGILGLGTYLETLGYKAAVWDADTSYDEGVLTYDNENRANAQNNYAASLENDSLYVWQEVRETIEKYDPDFVGITLMTPTLHSGLKIAQIAKDLGKIVIVGGPHVNIVREKVLKYDLIDYAFFGEGENSIPKFLEAYPNQEEIQKIQGVGYRRGEEQVFTGFAERIKDLDEFPHPDRDLLVFKERYMPSELATIMASRGCPFKCTFCASVPIWGRNTIYRSPEHIVAEIIDLHDRYNTRQFRFFDDTFTVNKKKLIGVCKLLVEKFGDRYFSWWCLSTVSSIDDEVLYWLKRAGADQVHLGIETGSDRVMKIIEKGCDKEQARNAILLSKKYGFWVNTFFITGFPFEEEADIRETMEFINEVKPDSVNLCTFTPYPGTALYDTCVEKGLLVPDEDYEQYKYIGHHSVSNFFMDTMTKEKYDELRDELLKITSDMSNKMTFRKFKYRLKNLTVKKVVRKVKLQIRKQAVMWRGPGQMLVQNVQIAETKRRHVSDGVGGLSIESPKTTPSS